MKNKNFVMPSLGADMEEGKFVHWLVKPGDAVKRGQVVCVVETKKGAIDVEIWDTGTLTELVAKPGDVIEVGGTLGVVVVEGDATSAPMATPAGAAKEVPGGQSGAQGTAVPARASEVTATTPAATAPTPQVNLPGAEGTDGARVRISPAARQRAQALGIAPDKLQPATPGQPITLQDVERAAAARASAAGALGAAAAAAAIAGTGSASAPQSGDHKPVDRQAAMREAIAAAMSRSKREIPHYYLGSHICVERAAAWLEQYNAARPVAGRVLFAALELRAVALALKALPELNGHFIDGAFRPGTGIHLGVAISLRGGGLVAPALRDADQLGLADLMTQLKDLLGRARGGQLRSSEMSEQTVTVTNLGDLGVESVYGVIYPPQVAIVGIGRVTLQPWVIDGKVVAARVLHATLAADHRVTDGMRGTRFLSELERLLQNPDELL